MGRYLDLVNHGGECCGIKTIHGFGYGPEALTGIIPARDKATKSDDRDANGRPVSSDSSFFTDAAPAENRVDRLKRYIGFMKKRRPCNLVEAVLAERQKEYCWSNQYKHWSPVLKELGFVEVVSHQNSNSGNTCHVFYLKIDEDYPGKEDDEDFE